MIPVHYNERAIAATTLGSAIVAVALWLFGWGAVALVLFAELIGMLWQASQTDAGETE